MSSSVALAAYEAGFGSVMVPVTVPGGKASDKSTLDAADMGKSPGKLGRDGAWYGVSVPTFAGCSREDAVEIDGWGANVGIMLGRDANLIALDNDADDPQAATLINDVIASMIPGFVARGVSSPGHLRLLFPVRIEGTLPRGSKITFVKGALTASMDLLSEGKQFVAWGTHARTRCAYTWTDDLTGWIDGPMQFPSITFERLGEIIEAIEQEMLVIGWTRASGSVSAQTVGVDANTKRTATEYELTRWLALLPNTDSDHQFDDRNAWVAMAHAIHGASMGAEWGRELWLRWCSQRAQDGDAPDRVWETLKGDGRLGLDYIREKARERVPAQAAQLDFEMTAPVDTATLEAMAASAKSGAIWPHLLPRYVFVLAQDKFYDMSTGISMSGRAFDMALGACAIQMRNELDPQEKRRLTPSQLFSQHPDAIKADNFIYWPGQPRLTQDKAGRLYVNQWRAASFKHRPGVKPVDIQPWLDLVEFVCGSKADAELFIKWLAFTIKMPGEKANWHPLIQTQPGIGKDTMMLPIIHALGASNVREVTADDLANQWTDFLEARMVYVSETRQHSRGQKSSHDVMNDLKTYLADKPEMVGVHRKGRDKYVVPNLTMWVFFSNEHQPVYLSEGDRRIWVVENFAAVRKDPTYYEAFHHWLTRNPDLVASYLMDLPLNQMDIRLLKGAAPDTHAKRVLIATSQDPILGTLMTIIEDARHGQHFPTLVVELRDVVAQLQQHLPGIRIPSPPRLGVYLRQAGARPVSENKVGEANPVRIPGTEGYKRLWVLSSTDAKGRDYGGLQPKDYASLYIEQKWPATGTRTTPTGEKLTLVEDDKI